MVDCGQRGVAEELKVLMSKRNRNGRLCEELKVL